MGEEPYYIDQISDYMQNDVLDESQREFDLTVVYGKDTDMTSIVNAAKRYPMMSPFQVVIVKEAQLIKDWEPLQYYINKPSQSTILVFVINTERPINGKNGYRILQNRVSCLNPKNCAIMKWGRGLVNMPETKM